MCVRVRVLTSIEQNSNFFGDKLHKKTEKWQTKILGTKTLCIFYSCVNAYKHDFMERKKNRLVSLIRYEYGVSIIKLNNK